MKSNGNAYLTDSQFSVRKWKDTHTPSGIDDFPFNIDDWTDVRVENSLTEWRNENNMSAREFTAELKLNGFTFSYQYVQTVETGKASPSFYFMFALVETFNLSIDDVFLSGAIIPSAVKTD